jgi:Na+/melibiose symporter-like transporter
MINDTFSATIIDRGTAKASARRKSSGKFTRYLAPLAPFLAISAVLMFVRLPFNNMNAVIAGCVIAYALWYVFRTFSDISLQSMQAVMSPLLQERGNYLTVGNLGETLSGAIPGLIPVAFDLLTKENINSDSFFGRLLSGIPAVSISGFYTYCTIVFCAIGLVAALFSGNLKERVFAPAKRQRALQNFVTFFKNKQMLLLWSGRLGDIIASVGWAAAPFFFRKSLGNYSIQTLIWSATGIPSFAVSLLSPLFLKRFTPRKVVIFNKLLCAACMFGMYFVCSALGYSSPLGIALIVIFNVICSIPGGVSGIAEKICVVNTFDSTELETGERAEATTYAVTGILNKGVTAVGIFLAGILMAKAGFVSGDDVVFSQSAKDSMFMFWAVFQGIGHVINCLPYFFYKLEGKRLDDIQQTLAERRKETAAVKEELPAQA